ncbi:MAG TPA: carboxypeptidase-like regulatory domain-containing protein [Ferruginibacter sp.]|nr:carboxypeptidase-like regulatory domain-containing protein [Ferruginibacter sp.]
MRVAFTFLLLLIALSLFSQSKTASITGKLVDENDNPISKVSVTILGKTKGITTNDSGYFSLKVAAGRSLALVFTHAGYNEEQRNFFLSEGEEEKITVQLERGSKTLTTVVVGDDKERTETGLTKINPKTAITLPSTTGGVEALIKILVGSNNELTSQYSVRGGNYDENLIYINDFEIFRPYLVRSGQQEGLSFINPELAKNVNFYTGGFQAKYGDKMSSVLDIQYKKPTSFGGSVYISLLEQGLHVEGASKKGKITYLVGVRNRSNKNILKSQETTGSYIPSSTDVQGLITYKLNEKIQLELLGTYSVTKFSLFPESAQKTTSVFSPLFTANLGLDILFEGQEKDGYKTNLIGLSFIHTPNKKLKLKWMVSRFQNIENENFDIAGSYLFGDRDFDRSSSTYGQIVNPLGAGYYQNYGRNQLDIDVYNASLKGSYAAGKHYIQFGNSFEQAKITDQLKEWEYQDSAGYSLPYNPAQLNLYTYLNSNANLSVQKYSGYVQDNIRLGKNGQDISLQAGIRYNYNSLNKEFLISPRMQFSIKPNWKKDLVFKLAAGVYNQPPFYRELRRYNGTLNTDVKAQKSFQLVAGVDYNFKGIQGRPFRLATEAYYKSMSSVDVYDIDNVKIRYAGNNDAKAYATGFEARLFGELVKDAESWLSIGIMQTKENLNNDFYYQYKNASGEIITSKSTDQVAVDSIKNEVGYVRRPTDRLITVGLYLEDYLPTNKNFKFHLNMLYGSNMSYNIPNSVKYRNALTIEPYLRVDAGFSAQLLSEKSKRRSHSPFRSFENIWASFEVFNLIDRRNTISYQLIKDFANNVYSIPNRLTPRLVNFKIVGRF